jgi:YidC/Oxa1 family membrane protein insertase
MEKRLALAFFLSFAILYLWFGSSPPPQTPSDDNPYEHNSFKVNKLEKESEERKVLSSPQDDLFESKKNSPDWELTNDRLKLTILSTGGNIHNIHLFFFDHIFPVNNILDYKLFSQQNFSLVEKSDRRLVIALNHDDYEVKRTYVLNGYVIEEKTQISLKNRKHLESLQKINLLSLDMSNLDLKSLAREKSLYEYVVNIDQKKAIRKNNAYKFTEKNNIQDSEEVLWMAFRDRYYSTIIKPDYQIGHFNLQTMDEDIFNMGVNLKVNSNDSPTQMELGHKIFAGPESLDILKEVDSGFVDIKKFYRFPLFDAIAKIIYEILHWLHKFIPNWGLCIILISVLIYFSMYPLTLKSMKSMKRMQAVQPKITRLREKYKDNPQRLNKEMMEIYRENKINPLGGCLPLLFQTPVFIGLYQVLWRDVSFKGASFLWIKDLSAPDRLFILPFSIPFIGNEINILPIVMMIVMFFQTKFQARNMVITDEAQRTQQKMMGFMMPIFLGVIFYKFASGLTLYFTMFYIFSSLTQFKMSREKI